MLLKFPTTKTHFTFSVPAAQLIAAEMPQAHEQRTPFYLNFFILKALAASLSLYPLDKPVGRKNPRRFYGMHRSAVVV